MISLPEAKALGLKRYFTGVACCNSHVCERYVSTRACLDCIKLNKKSEKNTASELRRKRAVYAKDSSKIDARNKNYAKNNKDVIAYISKRYYEKNKDKIKISKQKYGKSNPEVLKGYFRRRHAKIKGAAGSHTLQEIENLLVSQNYMCNNSHCKADLNISKELDHIVPLTPIDNAQTPGSNSINNLQWLCKSCNRSKGNKNWEKWIAGYATLAKDRVSS